MRTSFLAFFAVTCLGAVAGAADYQGAAAIIRGVEKNTPPPLPGKAGESELRADLKSFAARPPGLPPADAAGQWLTLLQRQLTLGPASPGAAAVSTSEVFLALPPPESWGALTQGIAKLTPTGKAPEAARLAALRLAAAALANDDAGQWKAFDELKTALAARKNAGLQAVVSIHRALAGTSDDAQKILASFEEDVRAAAPGEPSRYNRDRDLEVPALVRLAGRDRARDLLKEVFASAKYAQFSFAEDEETRALASEVALEMAGSLKVAPWELTHRLDATDLYEMLDRQFPGRDGRYSDRTTAGGYYLLGLIVKKRTDDAVAAAVKLAGGESNVSLPEEPLRDLAQRGFAPEVSAFFGRLLTDHPELPYWSSYIQAASFAGEIEVVVDRLRQRVEAAGSAVPAPLVGSFAAALLAADHVPEGVKELRERLASASPATSDSNNEDVVVASQAIRLGDLLDDRALLEEGLDAFVSLKEGTSLSDGLNTAFFLKAGRGPEREARLASSLKKALAELKKQRSRADAGYDGVEVLARYVYHGAQETALQLVALYGMAGRDHDVVALLDGFPSWGGRDLADLLVVPDKEKSCAIAAALARTGRKEAALRVVNALLDAHGGYDPAYALLIELSPETAGQRLDELFARDHFEERPLIWKARLALDRGNFDDAEKLLRQAIAIDPSDGEEGRGDRMRGYALLAETLERKGGAAEEAAHLRGAVKAIRLSEEADRYHQAGLLTRAIAMYQEALGYFSDAYCIQSRLAIQLAAVGRMEEAEAHYTKAYELMPGSFGRVESHCFGCERAFAGERAQGIAERVFLKLTAAQPNVPQNHYLLGYLREEQGRPAEALESYRAAVRLDPDYLNAWKKIGSLAIKNTERSQANLMLLRLDPRGLHTSVELAQITDLLALWHAEEAAGRVRPKPPEKIYPLAASGSRLDEEQAQIAPGKKQPSAESASGSLGKWRHENNDTPVQALLETGVISSVVSLLDEPGDGPEADD